MAHTISGLKNIRQNDKRRLRNRSIKSALRTQMRVVLEQVQKKDKASAEKSLRSAFSLFDRAARKGVIHANAAARYKSRLALRVAKIG
jgi:small subunit ribosomal protein S20